MSVLHQNFEAVDMGGAPAATAYINAGGRGTRLATLFPPHPQTGISKALLEIGEGDGPIINYHIARLRMQGFGTIVVGAGDQSQVAGYIQERYDGDEDIYTVTSPLQLGTAGDLYAAIATYPEIFSDTILIQNCDTLLDVDEPGLLGQHTGTGSGLTIVTTQLDSVPNRGAIVADEHQRVVFNAEAQQQEDMGIIEASGPITAVSSCGMLAVQKELIMEAGQDFRPGVQYSLYRHVMQHALRTSDVFAYDNGTNYFCDIGTPEEYKKTRDRIDLVHALLSKCVGYVNAA